ncbi:MAG: hypothetical protein M1541_01800 [Acidobacteria bacterium]|nr:hypothetical protein [Acidobacteriota bacterium]
MPPEWSADPVHRRLIELRNGLLQLHRALLQSEKNVYERDIARINSRFELLGLIIHDPWFAWLRELSGLVALIDETLEAKEPAGPEDADRLIAQARALLVPNETGTGFEKKYFEALQRDPDVVMAHASTLKVIASLT